MALGDSFGPLDPDRMTDAGMYVWAGIITIVVLAASYGVALWWQRWKEAKNR